MSKPCSYLVRYGNEAARFSDYSAALNFARLTAKSTGYTVEVSARKHKGLIAQYDGFTGELTPEFSHVAQQAA